MAAKSLFGAQSHVDESLFFSQEEQAKIRSAKDEYNTFIQENRTRLSKKLDLDVENVDRLCAGEDLQRAVASSRGVQSDEPAAHFRNKVTEWRNKTAKYQSAMDNLMSPFPKESLYASVICGSFKIMFTAAASAAAVESLAFECVDAIPQIIQDYTSDIRLFSKPSQYQNAQHTVDVFPSRTQILRRTCRVFGSLYVKILDVFTNVFTWIKRHTFSKLLRATVHGQTYANELRTLVEKVKEEANKLQVISVRAMLEQIGALPGFIQSEDDRVIETICDRLREGEVKNRLDFFEDLELLLQSRLQPLLNKVDMSFAWSFATCVLLFQSLREKSHAQHEKERRALGTDSNDAQAYVMSSSDALLCLSHDQMAIESSLRRARGLEHKISLKAQELAQSLLSVPELLHWTMDPSSNCLFVNGIIDTQKLKDKDCAFSLAVSAIISLLLQWPSTSIVVLCITSKYPHLSSVHGTLPSLIGQLLEHRPRLEVVGEPANRLRGGDFSEANFAEILFQLLCSLNNSDNVFIVVDDVRQHIRQTPGDLARVLSTLRAIAQARDMQATVKLLVISSTRTREGSILGTFRDCTVTPRPREYKGTGFKVSQWERNMLEANSSASHGTKSLSVGKSQKLAASQVQSPAGTLPDQERSLDDDSEDEALSFYSKASTESESEQNMIVEGLSSEDEAVIPDFSSEDSDSDAITFNVRNADKDKR